MLIPVLSGKRVFFLYLIKLTLTGSKQGLDPGFMQKYLFIIGLSFLAQVIRSQNTAIDSIFRVLAVSKDDTNKVKSYGDLSWVYMSIGSYDTALIYVERELELASSPILEGKAWQKGIAYAHNTMGVIYFNKGFYPMALQHYYAALRIQEKLNDKRGVASIHNGIGNIYGIQSQFDMALKYHLIALQIRKELGNKRGMANSYGNIGNLYYAKNDFSEALRNYGLSLDLMKETGNKMGIANAYGNIGLVFDAQNRLEDALESQYASLKIHEEIDDIQGQGVTYINLALLYTKIGKYQAAEQNALKGAKISEEIGDLESMKDAYHALSELYEKTKSHTKALSNYKKFIRTRDSLLNEENTKETMRLEMNYEFDKKEAATKLEQEKKEAVAAAESRKQKIILYFISAFGILVLIFAIFAYRSYLQKQKANLAILRQKELIEEKQKEILDSIYYARRIQNALLTSERYITRYVNKINRI